MYRVIVSTVVVGVFAFAIAVADEKKDEAKKPEAKPRLVQAGTITAMVVEVEGSTLRLRIPQARKPYGPGPKPQGKDRDKDNPDDLEITLAEDVKIRVPPRPELDDKGRPKPLKKDPKDPDRNLPGVRGTTSDLQKGVWVSVALAQTREKQPKTLATLVVVVDEGTKGERKK